MQFIRRFTLRAVAATCAVAAVVASFFALSGSAALAQSGGPAILSGPTAGSITDDSAVIRWTTDMESTTVVDFGTTEALGQTYRKIIPIEETEITETVHTMTLSSLKPGTGYFFRVSSSASGGKATSAVANFSTTGSSCSKDTWTCADWQACSADGMQSRTCTMTYDCPSVTTPVPERSQSCTRPCTDADWKCGEWGACDKDSQKRSCILSTACEGGTTSKPAETQRCTLPKQDIPKLPACTDTDWTCSEWTVCPASGATGTSRRSCTRPEKCDPGAGKERAKSETQDCPPVRSGKVEKNAEPEASPAPDVNAPAPSDAPSSPPSPPMSAGTVLGGGDEAASMRAECAANGVSAEDCTAWLNAKYGNHACAENGIFSKEGCDTFLRNSNGGVMPGCEGKTETECKDIAARMTAGYMPGSMRGEIDAMVATKKAGEMFDALGDAAPSVLAVRESHKQQVIWWPSKRAAGQETAPGMFVLDTDKDRLPDDVERRIGTDPNVSDAKVARNILKSYFEKGDKPTAAQRESRKELERFFETGDIPTQEESRRALGAFFGPGTVQPDNLTAVDAAFILGMSVGQPMGTGKTDDSFTVDAVNMPGSVGGSGITLHGHAASNAVVFLYIYSYVPMVLTTTADADGNYQYDIADNVVDGEHTAYVALIDGSGDVAAKSQPQSFFVKTALAVTESDFLATDAKLTPTTPTSKATSSYLYGVIALVIGGLTVAAFVLRGASERKGPPSRTPFGPQ